MKIVFVGGTPQQHQACLSDNLTIRHDMVCAKAPMSGDVGFATRANSADVIIALRLPRLHEGARGFRLLQTSGAGVDGIDQPSLPNTARFCNVLTRDAYRRVCILGHAEPGRCLRRDARRIHPRDVGRDLQCSNPAPGSRQTNGCADLVRATLEGGTIVN
jgi:hypothetical protein